MMTDEQRAEKSVKLRARISRLESKIFVLNAKLARLEKKLMAIQTDCTHEIENWICTICGAVDPTTGYG